MPNEAQAVEAAYARFFTAFNSQDPGQWAAALHYPHVRVAAIGEPSVIERAADLAAAMRWDRVRDTGWVRSVGAPPTLLHRGGDRAHVLGGWTRYDANGKTILTNQVAYVITRIADEWGIQARFGIDGPPDDSHAARAVALIEDFFDALNDHDWVACTNLMNFPTVLTDVGMARVWRSAEECAKALDQGPWHFLSEQRATAVQSGPKAVNVALKVALDGGDETQNALFLVTERDGHWGIQGRSIFAAA